MEKFLKIALAVMLFGCLLPLPYGYYQLVRFVAMVVFGILAFQANSRKQQVEFVIFLALALLFQPFLKIALGRTLWNIVDIVVGVFLLISVVKKERNE